MLVEAFREHSSASEGAAPHSSQNPSPLDPSQTGMSQQQGPVVGDVRAPYVHPPRTLRNQLFLMYFFVLFPKKDVARSKSLANMAKMAIFKMAAANFLFS